LLECNQLINLIAIFYARLSKKEGIMLEENKAIVRGFFERWDREGKMPADLCAPGFKAYIPGQSPMDANSFQEFQHRSPLHLSDWKNTVEDMVAEGDRVAFDSSTCNPYERSHGVPSMEENVMDHYRYCLAAC
jgi:hypothetical protein